MTPTGISKRRQQRARGQIAHDEERCAKQRRGWQDEPMVHADDQPHEMRHDDADEADWSGERYGRRSGE